MIYRSPRVCVLSSCCSRSLTSCRPSASVVVRRQRCPAQRKSSSDDKRLSKQEVVSKICPKGFFATLTPDRVATLSRCGRGASGVATHDKSTRER
ncbi:hypothetical protein M438DRAFT_341709 [Aureobasidium pullulans EXF-150]|uniref:Uncharacterized protein n=1 Tax=Aureobasidium pullulans EXF-150 TaxID=1043002 RepID=A0A074YT31_AURPU|nr:uncharacterized protein M438DRAFT_341709 [Aureobasidium pullulans EXF-150]KEQ90001.1 hypothetical protein M438DRAFT_341709 [Aureobasidium pullulans EXF-150]